VQAVSFDAIQGAAEATGWYFPKESIRAMSVNLIALIVYPKVILGRVLPE
jgi:hypothetical protein